MAFRLDQVDGGKCVAQRRPRCQAAQQFHVGMAGAGQHEMWASAHRAHAQ
ncbi:hypothetical protein SALB1_0727 [Salinisphaera sp. LB1]|nr:hypothetical protein SALB1_0727 [Salinisphaera sp. LB1]